jgi:hypothetical protein
MPQMLDVVLEQVSDFFSLNLTKQIQITRITPIALRTWTETWKTINNREPPNGGWNWIDKSKIFDRKYHKYLLDIAIWESNQLCGMALCTRSKGNDNLSIHYIEGSPNKKHPLQGYIFTIVETICMEYGILKSINAIRIIEPVDNLIEFYFSYGYNLQKKQLFGHKYLERGIKK